MACFADFIEAWYHKTSLSRQLTTLHNGVSQYVRRWVKPEPVITTRAQLRSSARAALRADPLGCPTLDRVPAEVSASAQFHGCITNHLEVDPADQIRPEHLGGGHRGLRLS